MPARPSSVRPCIRGAAGKLCGVLTDLAADSSLPSFLSLAFVLFAFGAAFASLATFLVEGHRHRRLADNSRKKAHELSEGWTAVRGRVRYAQGREAAVRIVVSLQGSEKKTKNGHSYSWQETERTIEAEPFYLDTPDGESIRIEPDDEVVLVDDLVPTDRPSKWRELRTAELSAGEEVFVEGLLSQDEDPERPISGAGYREASRAGWVMRPDDDPLLISSKGLEAPHRFAATQQNKAAAWTVLLLFIYAMCFGTFSARLLFGEVEEATIVDRSTRVSSGRSRTRHWNVEWLSAHQRGEDEVDSDEYARAPVGTRVTVRVVRSFPFASSIGSEPRLDVRMLLFALFSSLLFLFAFSAASRQPWYSGSVREGGSGRLPSTPGFPVG